MALHVLKVHGPCSWDFSGNFPGLSSIYLALLTSLYSVNPGMLYLVQGVGQLPLSGSGGAGFATDLSTVQAFNISSASSFFQQLLLQPYVNQVCIGSLCLVSIKHAACNWLFCMCHACRTGFQKKCKHLKQPYYPSEHLLGLPPACSLYGGIAPAFADACRMISRMLAKHKPVDHSTCS